MDQAIKAARSASAEVIVERFQDPIGRDRSHSMAARSEDATVLALHASPPLENIPDNRVYVSRDQADNFVGSFVLFANVADDRNAAAGEIGRPKQTYRHVRFSSQVRQHAGSGKRTTTCPIHSAVNLPDMR
jgi:hypothetical protein